MALFVILKGVSARRSEATSRRNVTLELPEVLRAGEGRKGFAGLLVRRR